MKNDPIELQCLAEQINAIVSTITDVVENNDDIEIDNNSLLVIYRTFHLTHRLKETCFNIHQITPTKDLVNDILSVLRRVEGLVSLYLLQKQETIIEGVLAEVIYMASEAQAEANRLWGGSNRQHGGD